MKTATEHDKRDPIVAYYCRLYAMQKGMEIDMKSPDCRIFLVTMMDYLEKAKKELYEADAIQSEVVGQAHMENYALKVFLFADNEDRAARFNKNVVKSFYTAGMLFDVLTVFGELSEDIEKNKKYAKWKAAYIHRCLKNGETPDTWPDGRRRGRRSCCRWRIPATWDIGHDLIGQHGEQSLHPSSGSFAPPTTPQDPPQNAYQQPPQNPYQAPPQQPAPAQFSQPVVPNTWTPPPNPGGVQLTTEHFQKALKLCKYASSALQYEDSKTAVDNLQKALQLLTTGHHS
ncbi:vacuolar protein sorting-associated protein VTA1 homolog [Haliotis rubra]|uniref:vacuolar protein sorting-associated protein VTA1 homolog n=1 Tax=Haliotis rubra TaxID=36100 RepID=UPI001EE5C684|nr:vacuolar protein sorting-associated protein VTA1 homolog [Haliotis rubra]